MSKGGLPTIQHAELDVIADVVLTGHDLCPRGCADRVGEAVGEAHALRRQLVQIRRLAGFAAVGGQGFIAHVVGHDENDVGALGGVDAM